MCCSNQTILDDTHTKCVVIAKLVLLDDQILTAPKTLHAHKALKEDSSIVNHLQPSTGATCRVIQGTIMHYLGLLENQSIQLVISEGNPHPTPKQT